VKLVSAHKEGESIYLYEFRLFGELK